MPKYTEEQLLKAVRYAQKHPDIPLTRIATLYEVNLSTLRRRKLGLTLPPSQAHRHEQLFSPGEEKAIAKHCIMMADHNFPMSHDLLRGLAQDILNSRVLPKPITTQHQQQFRQVGEDWVDRFLKRNPEIKTKLVRHQERSRLAISNNLELQRDFLKQLANLIRRLKVQEENIWNCDEKGITMGRQSMKTKVIVRAGTKGVAGSDGNREFVSVLETVNAAGQVISPFIVWTGNVHTESYYPKYVHGSSAKFEGTFAVSKSGYMDNDLGMQYMKQHFEPHTRRMIDGKVLTRILIVDGHASHLNYSMLSWALEQNIHVICLPSKSTHILQPLDVGCFGLLQRRYEHNLGLWIIANPLGLVNKVVFLEILYKTREEVYTKETIQSAWRAAHCWPVNLNLARGTGVIDHDNMQAQAVSHTMASGAGFTSTSGSTLSLQADVLPGSTKPIPNTPQVLRQLESSFKEKVPLDCSTHKDLLDTFYSYVDKAMEKLTSYRDIAPRAHTLNALRNGKARMKIAGRRRHLTGAGRVMTEKEIRSGLEQLFQSEKQRVEKQRLAEERKSAMEVQKNIRVAAEKQWKIEKMQYEMERDSWELECHTIEDNWRQERDAARAAKVKPPKKPTMPPRPKKPSKRLHNKPTDERDHEVDHGEEEVPDSVDDVETMVEWMRELEIEEFASVRRSPPRTHFPHRKILTLDDGRV